MPERFLDLFTLYSRGLACLGVGLAVLGGAGLLAAAILILRRRRVEAPAPVYSLEGPSGSQLEETVRVQRPGSTGLVVAVVLIVLSLCLCCGAGAVLVPGAGLRSPMPGPLKGITLPPVTIAVPTAITLPRITIVVPTGIIRQPLCTPPACRPGEVLVCPGICPGGCGFICATPTPGPGR